MAYTVDGAIAAVQQTQATLPPEQAAYIRAHVTINDAAGGGSVQGTGSLMIPYYKTALLGDLGWVADPQFWFLMQRGGAGPQFLLGLDIEPIITIGPVVFRPPASMISLLQRFTFLWRKHYWGHFAIYLQYQQPHFNVTLSEDQVNPRLTGTISPSALSVGPIVPPASVEVILDSVEVADVFQ
jgi:hypothetical protein